MDHLFDEELVQECLSGKQEAFEVLVKRYEKQIFSLAFRLCGNYDEAADLAQDAFIQVYKALPKYDNSRRFFPWLYRVAHNVCINGMQKRPKPAVPIEDLAGVVSREDGADQPEVQYANLEMRQTIYQVMVDLPEQFREAVILRYVEELSYKEIATRLDLPVSTIETRLYRGRQLLQEKLSQYVGRRRR